MRGKERFVPAASGLGGLGSIAAAHNVCHSLCLAVVALLSLFGIAVAADTLMWLEAYAVPLWLMGLAFLAAGFYLYVKMPGCMRSEPLAFNSGLLIAGVPFAPLQGSILLYSIGGAVAATAAVAWISKSYSTPSLRRLAMPVGIMVIAVAAFYLLFFGPAYEAALAAENPSDKCAPPPGYTDESWREHMSHHPDSYADCLGTLK